MRAMGGREVRKMRLQDAGKGRMGFREMPARKMGIAGYFDLALCRFFLARSASHDKHTPGKLIEKQSFGF